MAEQDVITSMLDDLSSEQPIYSALCVGQEIDTNNHIQWHYFSAKALLNLPFTERYDVAFVVLNDSSWFELNDQQQSQLMVKLRDLLAKRIVVIAQESDAKWLRSLGFTQLLEYKKSNQVVNVWQFNILTYKQVPDWFNSKFWANPENWDKFRW